jgi:D-beta-D-heptose 7-phosphate kinase/D-beta-D-heptose 1-phosphate adenosyltransferase
LSGSPTGCAALEETLNRFDGLRVLVVGDSMLDQWIWGSCTQISPEAPVPIVDWGSSSYGPGGAANVAKNVVTLGGEAVLAGVVGDDRSGARLRAVTEEAGVSAEHLLRVADRRTTSKTRVYAGQHQLLRVDRGSTDPIAESAAAELRERCRQLAGEVDLVIFSDYDKGVLGTGLGPVVLAGAERGRPWLTAGPKPPTVAQMGNAQLVSLNRQEAEAFCGVPEGEHRDPAALGAQIVAQCAIEALAITLGGDGVVLVCRDQPAVTYPAFEAEVFDACGCGDSFLAAASIALATGADAEQAIEIGNRAGAAAARVVGVGGVTREEISAVERRGSYVAAGSPPGP